MVKDKYLLLSVIENYLLLTNTFSDRNGYLNDYLYKLSIYHSVTDLNTYLRGLKSEYIEFSKPVVLKRTKFSLN